ncbi:hypothetical protein SCHPADRAFT_947535 [Schizopora paradoxa]|uniref:Uncharacterized protein n=1 Tax=Schizopora paradoxa TaxID=27342 RepID=A0A0H2R082_9AGAM|nr:hypothetical protein SCHPADRAFT_947535 [Schizopora paradoxa]
MEGDGFGAKNEDGRRSEDFADGMGIIGRIERWRAASIVGGEGEAEDGERASTSRDASRCKGTKQKRAIRVVDPPTSTYPASCAASRPVPAISRERGQALHESGKRVRRVESRDEADRGKQQC